MDLSELQEALAAPVGATFRLAALHVNPYGYSGRDSGFNSASAYNSAMIDAMLDRGVQVVGLADHHNVKSSRTLINALNAVGITAFPGFETSSKEGVHVVCLFDPSEDFSAIDRRIGELGVQPGAELDSGALSLDELLRRVEQDWGAVAIAAHAMLNGGLLSNLKGKARAAAWKSPHLHAASIPCAPEKVIDQSLRDILTGKAEAYQRERPIALIGASDVSRPVDLSKDSATTWVKMSSEGVESLHQAFLDPDSRIRRNDEPRESGHPTIELVAWEGGFLDGGILRLNPALNTIIGGRGTGKSTVVESIRFVLGQQPSDSSLLALHKSLIEHVLGPGSRVTVAVRSTSPDDRRYFIQRDVGEPPLVLDAEFRETGLRPSDVLNVEVYGQHELIELAKPTVSRLSLLRRFVDEWEGLDQRVRESRRKVAETKPLVADLLHRLEALGEEKAELIAAQEQLRRYQSAGLDDEVRLQGEYAREHQVFAEARRRLVDVSSEISGVVDDVAPIDLAFLADRVVGELPSSDLLVQLRSRLESASEVISAVWAEAGEALNEALTETDALEADWAQRKEEADRRYKEVLKKLGTERASAQEFVDLRKRVERLQSVDRSRRELAARLKKLRNTRQDLLRELAARRDERVAQYRKAARGLTRSTEQAVRVTVHENVDSSELIDLFAERLPGRTAELRDILKSQHRVDPAEIAEAARSGVDAVSALLPGLPQRQARTLADCEEDVLMDIEECEIQPQLAIELLVAPNSYRELAQLSTGQKATAMLILLLVETEDPLIVDQPEDDLDNSFIAAGVVPRLRDAKTKRQFLMSTHNANIPVLGDAEAIAVMESHGSPGEDDGLAEIIAIGSIDDADVRHHVESLLEGGRAAFELRRRKYGY